MTFSASQAQFDEAKTGKLYDTASSVLALSPQDANKSRPAHIQGVITGSTDLGFTVQDSTAGIWVYWDHSAEFSAGDRVEVQGFTSPGLFTPAISANSVRKLGTATMPKPEQVSFRELSSGDKDCQYVSVTGTVRSAGVRESRPHTFRLWLKIAMTDGMVDATLPMGNLVEGTKLVDSVVRIDSPAMCQKNQTRQITAVTLPVQNIHRVVVLRPPPQDLFGQPLTPIAILMQYRSGTDYFHRVRVGGTVTYYKPGESLVMEDGGRALLVTTAQTDELRIGDHIEVAGFPAPERGGPILQDAVFRRLSHGDPPRPMSLSLSQIAAQVPNHNIVTTQGHLVRFLQEPSREVLLLQDGSRLLMAELARPIRASFPDALREGSIVRVTGISMLEVKGAWHFGNPADFTVTPKLVIRSYRDIEILEPPSWWDTRHVLYIAGVFGALMLAFLVLVFYNWMERWRLHAVLDERERLAHELHDTLAQSFAGIGFQLQAMRKAIPADNGRLQQQLELAGALVRHSHKEARRSMEPLHLDVHEEVVDLLATLEQSAYKMFEGGSVTITGEKSGDARQLPPAIGMTLLRIGQEAIANSARHADPTHLQIHVGYTKGTVRLAVKDDGAGFVKSGDLLGFGLRGMRSRAASISAKLKIVSEIGVGTRVEVEAPTPPNAMLIDLFQRLRIYLLEIIPYAKTKQQPSKDSDR
ncbi:MAG: two-component system sensor kinase [Acidobacteriaceae bacterium]|nr:two-component system sensor kinase [Acidobacteriaceae bacterium]